MSKLSKKLFAVLMSILTLCTAVILIFIITHQYQSEYDSTSNKLSVIEMNRLGDFRDLPFDRHNGESFPPNFIENNNEQKWNNDIRYIDSVVYSVKINDNNEIVEIIHHSNSSLTDEEITEVAQEILSNNSKDAKYIGNLFTERFSYSLAMGQELTIIDNNSINNELRKMLKQCLLIFILAEILLFIICKMIVRWIVKPVQESFDKQKQFIADASHELKTPLTVIMASADAYSDSREEKWLDNIKTESERMNKLVKNLLDLAQSEDAISTMVLEEGNLSKIVEKVVLSYEVLMFENGLVLDYDIDPNILIKMNSDSIEELCIILLDNAMKHSVANGHIEVKLKKSTDIILSITNVGEAIPIGDEERIFERFYRGDVSRNRDSNRYGLGLAIAKNIVIGHNAQISASSNEGKTRFVVRFN